MRILREPSVIQKTGVSRATIRRWERCGNFPARVHIGPNCVGWIESEVNDFLAAQAAKRAGIETNLENTPAKDNAQ